jgi:tRNA:m(5)U-54 methyltransferase
MIRSLTPIHIIGGGLAGSEAAWQVARRGVPVVLHEMRPVRSTAAHRGEKFAELVCSNSFRSDDAEARHPMRGSETIAMMQGRFAGIAISGYASGNLTGARHGAH